MNILVVAATKEEISPLIAHFNLRETEFIETANFDVLITGVGMTATAFSLGQYLAEKYTLVLNVGIAGSFERTIQLGQVVNVTKDVFAELGAENDDEFITINDLGFGNNTFTSTANLVVNLRSVDAITVNKVHGNSISIEKTIKNFNPKVESMEGAAVFYACQKIGLPCLQIRSISNYVEPRTRANWRIDLAIKNLNDWLINFLSVS